jgi:molecular chaperone DnaK
MVGGTSKIEYIQDYIADQTGLCPKTNIDPDRAVVFGGAYACIQELQDQGKSQSLWGKVIPAPDVFIQDVTAHPIGCCVVDLSTSQKRLINAMMIQKNTPIPCKHSERFYLEHEDQVEVRIEVLQGEADEDRDDCLLIGEFKLTNLPKETRLTQRIQVEYIIDGNGMVTATARDLVSGQQQSISVDYTKGIQTKQKPSAA